MRVRWTQPAAQDLTQICDFIQERRSPATARRVAMTILHSVSRLAQFPETGRVGKLPGTRELVIARLPYLAIYRVRSEAIEILRILHGAQQRP